jgi:hypothetical protein
MTDVPPWSPDRPRARVAETQGLIKTCRYSPSCGRKTASVADARAAPRKTGDEPAYAGRVASSHRRFAGKGRRCRRYSAAAGTRARRRRLKQGRCHARRGPRTHRVICESCHGQRNRIPAPVLSVSRFARVPGRLPVAASPYTGTAAACRATPAQDRRLSGGAGFTGTTCAAELPRSMPGGGRARAADSMPGTKPVYPSVGGRRPSSWQT